TSPGITIMPPRRRRYGSDETDYTSGARIVCPDRFPPRRGPPGDDALRAGSTTSEREGAATWVSPRRRWSKRPLEDAALSDMAKDKVQDGDQEDLFVEGIGVAVLVGRCLEERDRREMAGAGGPPEPTEVVEVVGLIGPADHGHRRRRQVERV